MNSCLFWLALAIWILSATAAPVSSPRTVGSYNQFLTSDTISVDTTQSYANSSASWNPISFTKTFPPSFVKVKTAQICYGLQSINI